MTEFLMEILTISMMVIANILGFIGLCLGLPLIISFIMGIIKAFKEGDKEMDILDGRLILLSGDEKRIEKMVGLVYNKLTNGRNGIKLRLRFDAEYGFLKIVAIHEDGSEKETKILVSELLSGDDEIINRLKKELGLT